MRSSSTIAILFWIHTSRAVDSKTKIYVRIILNGKRVKISLKEKIDIDSWNAKYVIVGIEN